ncbi:hypothetical protein B0H34DRAFT_716924 [Crassisporium funariophilum]|nr:hypothetical protein B0H34DRAFT_716924 [Crassisporium funariophilum]
MEGGTRCAALNAAMARKGMDYSQLAAAINVSETRVKDICAGKFRATNAEFRLMAKVLEIPDTVENTGVHATTA